MEENCRWRNRVPENENVRSYPLNRIYFYLTEGCNLRCRHCWINPKYQSGETSWPSLDFALFRHIVGQAKPLGLTGVKLTGGEPLLHPDISGILEYLRLQELGVTIETNGVPCTQSIADQIATLKTPFVSVSIDGADGETHDWVRGVKGSFEEALRGVRNLVKAGLKPQIIMSVMRRNREQIEPVVRLAESLGAGSVKCNIVQPTARGELMKEAGESLTIHELTEIGAWVENTLAKETTLPVMYGHPRAFRPLSAMFGEKADGCGTCKILNIMGVLSDGAYAMCGIGEAVPELIYGHAERDSLEEVWNQAPLLLELREGLPHKLEGICGDCLMKKICLGSCIAQNYYKSKHLWAPFWYCEEARETGVFPEGRKKGAGRRFLPMNK
jgi:SynChlorMet cassette radical SAM/SPASM protein ScmF